MSLSEDDASDDNFEIDELYNQVYLRGHLLENDMKQIKVAETECKR